MDSTFRKEPTAKGFPAHLLILSLVFSAVIVAFGLWFYQAQKAAILHRTENELSTVSNLKADEITAWFRERLADAKVLSDNRYLTARAIRYLRNPQTEDGKSILARMDGLIEHYKYHEVLLVSETGEICLRSEHGPRQLNPQTRDAIKKALLDREPVLVDLFVDDASHDIFMDVVIPVINEETGAADLRGAVILRIDPEDYLYPLTTKWPTPSETAEILLIRREGEEVLYLNELRHRPEAAMKLRIPLSRTELPSVQAALGGRGILEGTDYRGVRVLISVSRVPNTSWLILAKMDYREILLPFQIQGWLIICLVILSILIATGVFYISWQRNSTEYFRSQYHAQLERQNLQKRYDYLMKSANDIILLMDKAGRFVEVNERALDAYGYTKEEFFQRLSTADIIAPQDRESFQQKMDESKKAGAYVREGRHARKDGSEFPVEASARWIEVDGQEYLLSIVRDVTERNNLYKDKLFFSQTMDASLNELYLFDPVSFHFRYANQGALGNLGYTLDEMKRLTPLDLKAEFTSATFQKILSSLISRQKDLQIFETTHRRKDGTQYPVEVRLQLIDQGSDRVFLAVVLDVTERKKVEQFREQLMKSLREKTEEMENLLYVSSHDLRSPLVNIQGFSRRLENLVQTLDQSIENSADMEEVRATVLPILKERIPSSLKYILASATKMDTLINGLLRISRLGRAPLNPSLVDMNQLMQSILATMEHQIQEAGATIECSQLPPCWGDSCQINQVFSNLIDNALKYRDENHPLVVQISGEVLADQVKYAVEDNGIGIKSEYQKNIWGLFTRIDPLGKTPGEGLGLTVVKKIVHRLHGTVNLESAPDHGCRFLITLPARETSNESQENHDRGRGTDT